MDFGRKLEHPGETQTRGENVHSTHGVKVMLDSPSVKVQYSTPILGDVINYMQVLVFNTYQIFGIIYYWRESK